VKGGERENCGNVEGSLCKEFELHGVNSLFIAYNDFTPEERSMYVIDGPRFHILDPFTHLRITTITWLA